MKISHSLKHDRWYASRWFGTVTIGILSTIGLSHPAQADTLAQSAAAAGLYNFSQRPTGADATTFQEAIAIGSPDHVRASAFADAEFLSQNGATGQNQSVSLASGSGPNYRAAAQSEASIVGRDFNVGANQSFSFDWASTLFVNATSTNSTKERSSATGIFGFEIYTRDPDNQLRLVDTLDLFGRDDQASNPLFNFNATSGFNVVKEQIANQFSLLGRYSKHVDRATQFTVFELKHNEVSVAAPEPAIAIAFVALGVTARACKRRRSV
jgi:hypothetical protein